MRLRKIGWLCIVLTLVAGLIHAMPVNAAASKYTGGLLDGVPLPTGSAIGKPSGSPVTQLTDNNASTAYRLNAGTFVWNTFSEPAEITAVIVNRTAGTNAVIEFYDPDDHLLLSYQPVVNDGVVSLPVSLRNVKTAVLKSTGSYSTIAEWNVFATPSAPPSVPAINWIQAGDKTVTLEWGSTGAKSYHVKRATSPGGPYAMLAANVKDPAYTDKSVTNGITYYYVVSAMNEAGESGHSGEKSIRPNATKYTGGLLDGLTLKAGTTLANPTESIRVLTDNNASSAYRLNAGKLIWHTFSEPAEITAVIVNRTAGTNVVIEFYDAEDHLLLSYNPIINDGIESLPVSVTNVKRAVVKPTGSYSTLAEWNVFAAPSFPPSVPAMNWVYGGDQTVMLEWGSTGAKAYHIKRATSPGGPYAMLASNVKGTAYTDKAVTNGVTYYYVVSAVNEAGESAHSGEKSIRPNATKYTGGLLDGLTLKGGASLANPTESVRVLTDNNASSAYRLNAGKFVWHTFSAPAEITAVIMNKTAGTNAVIEFYDADEQLLLSYNPVVNDGIESLPVPVSNVKTVVLKSTGSYSTIAEWNVFGKTTGVPPAEPIVLNGTAGDASVTLSWNTLNDATGYHVKRSATTGGPYATIATVTSSTYGYIDSSVMNGTVYYYVVTALYEAEELATSNEVAVTPQAGNKPGPGPGEPGEPGGEGDRALLRIMLINGADKEYDLSMQEVNAFISWYEGRAAGTGPITFSIDKHGNNKGPFKQRKDVIIYDKIITFEINSYENGQKAS
ncbi:hypothetical protein HFN20_01755 [Paenibacillus dendritiformis]|uniref:hypothetical protein n=1 Tax=Paenibacillus dendritiformis TaxID=130049 RepID=UPI00143D2ED8|nr:hypothetical protein [Paenibacillus dendritiformis]NKI19971.1 hypothetical protein [Paenibacillus dendritiformis]NRF99987.1 hypothetical protein [Paenibacillus dendritiformis]